MIHQTVKVGSFFSNVLRLWLINNFTTRHCKPKPCIAHREPPVSQFQQGKSCFNYRVPLFSLQGPCFHYTNFPVNPCTTLLGIAVYCTTYKVIAVKELYPNSFRISSVTGKISNTCRKTLDSFYQTILKLIFKESFPNQNYFFFEVHSLVVFCIRVL